MGYLGAHFYGLQSIWSTLSFALLLLVISLPLYRSKLWHVFFPIAVGLLAYTWANQQNIEPPPIWEQLPPREIRIEGAIEGVYPGKVYPNRVYATVRIINPPALIAELEGQKLFASISKKISAGPIRQHAKVSLLGILHPVPKTEDPFTDFLNSREINFQLRQGVVLKELEPPHQIQLWILALRKNWETWLSSAPPKFTTGGGLLAAMILGEREFLTPEQEETFLSAGAMHLFAVSGLHVMIVGLTLDQLLKLLRLPFFRRRLIAIAFVGLYVAVIGFSPSALRAFSIMALYYLASILPRPVKPMPVILSSALLTLVINPAQLYSIGFQLSYSVVISIINFGLPLIELVHNRWPSYSLSIEADLSDRQRCQRWLKRKFVESVCISISATLGSAPLIILHFGLWTPGAIILNAFLVPIATLVVGCGVVIILTNSFGIGFFAGFAAYPAWLLISIMEHLSFAAIQLPGFYTELRWISPTLAYTALISFLILLIIAPKKGAAYSRTLYLGGITIFLLSLIFIGTHPI